MDVSYFLLISLPPHGLDFDPEQAARVFGRTAAELRLRAQAPLPEILAADTYRGALDAKASDLCASGFNCTVIEGAALAALPPLNQLDAFEFKDAEATFYLAHGSLTLSAPVPCFAVLARPRPGPASRVDTFVAALRRNRPDAVESGKTNIVKGRPPEALAFFDLYFMHGGRLQRLTHVEGLVDYVPLGPLKKMTSRENFRVLLEACAARFQPFTLDASLEGAICNPSALGGLALPRVYAALLGTDQPEPCDIASRLLYLTAGAHLLQPGGLPDAEAEPAPAPAAEDAAPSVPAVDPAPKRKARLRFED